MTAGWQEREGEDDELRAHVARDFVNLRLYERAELALAEDPELAAGLRQRQERLHDLQELYRVRLDHALEAARKMQRIPSRPMVDEHRRAAIRALRTLDRQHLSRARRIHEEFEAEWQPQRRPAVLRHREELRGLLERVEALAVAGGHVAVLLNRMRLFNILPLLDGRPLLAWSAGAMALSDRVVLFHDSPPQGAGNAEVLVGGLAAARNIVPLPHGRRRLDLDDPLRVSLFARRFSPATCVVLDPGTRLTWDGDEWSVGPDTLRLDRRGRPREIRNA